MVSIYTYEAMNDKEKKEWRKISKGWAGWVINNSEAKNTSELENMYEVGLLTSGKWAILNKKTGKSTGFESNLKKSVDTLWADAMQNYGR